jgi:hypothetical protein
MRFIELELVARGGIEPPTRGFSVAGTVDPGAGKSKTRQSLSAGFGLGGTRPNPYRTISARFRRRGPYPHAAQRVAQATTDLGPSSAEVRR